MTKLIISPSTVRERVTTFSWYIENPIKGSAGMIRRISTNLIRDILARPPEQEILTKDGVSAITSLINICCTLSITPKAFPLAQAVLLAHIKSPDPEHPVTSTIRGILDQVASTVLSRASSESGLLEAFFSDPQRFSAALRAIHVKRGVDNRLKILQDRRATAN